MLRVRVAALLLALCPLGCSLPEPKDLVSKRAEQRMSANQLHNLGLAHLKGGDFAACARVYARVLERKRMVRSYLNLGLCLERLGRADAAEAAFAAAVARAPEDPRGWLGRAIARSAGGDGAGASADLARLRSLEPELADRIHAPDSISLERRIGARLPTPRQAPLGIMGD